MNSPVTPRGLSDWQIEVPVRPRNPATLVIPCDCQRANGELLEIKTKSRKKSRRPLKLGSTYPLRRMTTNSTVAAARRLSAIAEQESLAPDIFGKEVDEIENEIEPEEKNNANN